MDRTSRWKDVGSMRQWHHFVPSVELGNKERSYKNAPMAWLRFAKFCGWTNERSPFAHTTAGRKPAEDIGKPRSKQTEDLRRRSFVSELVQDSGAKKELIWGKCRVNCVFYWKTWVVSFVLMRTHMRIRFFGYSMYFPDINFLGSSATIVFYHKK